VSHYSLQEACAQLAVLVERAARGEEVIVQGEGGARARLVPAEPDGAPPVFQRKPGSAAGQVWMADDFDAPLEDFADY
jgi:antitoxin (DNA-binding transcriptional repressor) of toxin-antitoxin stability system